MNDTGLSDALDSLLKDNDTEYYPGSRRQRREAPKDSGIEFVADPWRDNYTVKRMNGKETPMYTIGALADALGVSVQTIRTWTRQSILPQAPFRMPSTMIVQGNQVEGRRLYTEEEIDATIKVFEDNNILGKRRVDWKNYPDVPMEIQQAWSRIARQRAYRAKHGNK